MNCRQQGRPEWLDLNIAPPEAPPGLTHKDRRLRLDAERVFTFYARQGIEIVVIRLGEPPSFRSRSRKIKGSANGCAGSRRRTTARPHDRMAAYAPKATAALVAHAGSIRGETLHMAGMARNRRLARAVAGAGSAAFMRRSSAFLVANSALCGGQNEALTLALRAGQTRWRSH